MNTFLAALALFVQGTDVGAGRTTSSTSPVKADLPSALLSCSIHHLLLLCLASHHRCTIDFRSKNFLWLLPVAVTTREKEKPHTPPSFPSGFPKESKNVKVTQASRTAIDIARNRILQAHNPLSSFRHDYLLRETTTASSPNIPLSPDSCTLQHARVACISPMHHCDSGLVIVRRPLLHCFLPAASLLLFHCPSSRFSFLFLGEHGERSQPQTVGAAVRHTTRQGERKNAATCGTRPVPYRTVIRCSSRVCVYVRLLVPYVLCGRFFSRMRCSAP